MKCQYWLWNPEAEIFPLSRPLDVLVWRQMVVFQPSRRCIIPFSLKG